VTAWGHKPMQSKAAKGVSRKPGAARTQPEATRTAALTPLSLSHTLSDTHLSYKNPYRFMVASLPGLYSVALCRHRMTTIAMGRPATYTRPITKP
jgi:hypothetical protein